MKNIQRPKLSDIVSETLVSFILDNNLKPDEKLPTEHELAHRLNIGRTSVREGIRLLEATGLLSCRQGYGVTVNEVTIDTLLSIDRKVPFAKFLVMTKQQVLDLMDFRVLIELDACRLAAEYVKPSDLKALGRFLELMEGNVSKPDSFVVPDIDFHKQIAIASANSIYPRILGLISELFWKQQVITAALPGAQERALGFHREIYEALKGKDPELAVKVMRKHLQNTKAALEDHL